MSSTVVEVSKSTKIITISLLIVPPPKTETYIVVMINNFDDNIIKIMTITREFLTRGTILNCLPVTYIHGFTHFPSISVLTVPHASVDILDTPGYVLKKKDSPKKLELCFMGDMRETLVDVSEAFSKHFDEEKLPVLHITKFDMIGETEGTTQVKDNYLLHIVKCKSITF